MKSILEKYTKQDLDEFVRRKSVPKIDELEVYELIDDVIKYHKGHTRKLDFLKLLEDRWYKSLESGHPDYSIYSEKYYIADLWACWIIYSRKYLLSVKKILSNLPIRKVADLGCGIGYTTAGLKEIFSSAVVYGTNIIGTHQWEIANEIGKDYDFSLCTTVQPDTDLIFASEYFEHIENPVEHLIEILQKANPQYLVIANSFGSHSLGHFDKYTFEGKSISNRKIGKIFNSALRRNGYEQIKTDLWNNRPVFWRKK